MAKVFCGRCGAEIEMGSADLGNVLTQVVSRESSGTYILKPKDAGTNMDIIKQALGLGEAVNTNKTSGVKENRKMSILQDKLDELKAKGFDTSKYFVLTNPQGHEVTMKWENGVPQVTDETDYITRQIMEMGKIKSAHSFRRWITAQMFTAMNYSNWRGDKRGYQAYINMLGWGYMWKQLEHELYVLSLMQYQKDPEFEKRARFTTKQVVISILEEYVSKIEKLAESAERLHSRRKCSINGNHIYIKMFSENYWVDEFENRFITPIRDVIDSFSDASDYGVMHEIIAHFISGKYCKKINKLSPLSRWVDSFKGLGVYYSMDNLIWYSGLRVHDNYGERLSREDSLAVLEAKVNECVKAGENYKLLRLFKDTIDAENFSFSELMARKYANEPADKVTSRGRKHNRF